MTAWRRLLEERPYGGYHLIMADPPWPFEVRSAKGKTRLHPESHYATMTLAEIAALPVRELAAKNCVLWLWTTWPLIFEARPVLEAWGFAYSTGGNWGKQGPSGKPQIGGGFRMRCSGEPYLIGTLGSPRVLDRGIPNCWTAPRRQHSRKPDEAFAYAARMVAEGAPKLDLFSRQPRPGWHAFGNEIDKFPSLAAEPPPAVAAE